MGPQKTLAERRDVEPPATRRPSRTKGAAGRALVAVVLVLVWLGISGVGGPTFGKLGEVQTNGQASFLPASAEATRALEWQQRFTGTDAIPAVVLIEAGDAAGLAEVDTEALAEDIRGGAALEGELVGPFPSEDGLALEYLVPLSTEADVDTAVDELRSLVDAAAPAGVQAYVTGPAGFSADLVEAFGGIDGILLGVALLAVLVILLLVYRSLLLPFTVLFTSVAALCAAVLAVYYMAKWDWIKLDGQGQGILSILVIGAATDYALLMVARHKEALTAGQGRFEAAVSALKGAAEPILASAGTVTVGLLCLMFSDLNSNKALGPIGAAGIVFSVVAALTFLPAALALLGPAAYWPFVPRPERSTGGHAAKRVGLWGGISSFVGRHPRPIWALTALVLVVGCLGITQLKANGVPQSELVLGETESAAGQQALARHFDAGTGSPAFVVTDAAGSQAMLADVEAVDGVASAYVQAEDGGPAGVGAPGAERPAMEVDGRVLISVTLADAADSPEAEATVVGLREATHAMDAEALVGGSTATSLDTNATAQADLVKIIPLILGAILLILMLVLRSVVAPVLLIVTTVLSYGTALGVSALVFNGIFGFSGADPSVPLFGFVFLVALGVDYNIFLMTRVREESLLHGTREGVLRGLTVTGGVITSAGIVLAATFAALGVIPIMFLVQLGFIVAFGVLLDTLVVRSLLVPALALDIGRFIWWPGKLYKRRDAADHEASVRG